MLTWFFQQGPILLGLPPPIDEKEGDSTHSADSDAAPLDDAWKEFPCHKDEYQVQLDVNRSFVHYPNGMSLNNPPTYPTSGQSRAKEAADGVIVPLTSINNFFL